MSRFVKPQYIVGAGDDITKINYDEPNVQLDKVHIGKLKKLLEEGDISSHAASKFMKGVRVFYESAVAYGLSIFPWMNSLRMHNSWTSKGDWKLILRKLLILWSVLVNFCDTQM